MILGVLKRFERLLLGRRAYKFSLLSWQPIADVEAAADVLRTMRSARVLEPLVLDEPPAGSILVIAPHTDDETIGPGGTLLKASAADARVHVVYLTTNTAARTEAAEASKLGGYTIEFLEFEKGAIPLIAADALASIIRRERPRYLHVPFLLDDHDDHRRANQILLRAGPDLPAEIEVWAYQVYGFVPPNVIVDITDVADKKRALIRCWHSQMRKRDWAHYALGMNAVNARNIRRAGPRYGEAFFVVPLREYLDLCARYFATPQNAYLSRYRSE